MTGREDQPAWGQQASQGFLDIYRGVPAGEHINPATIDVVAEAQAMPNSPLALSAEATALLCPYPQRAIYNAHGAMDEASSYHCGK
ncbi:MAG TPA: hypothetical protein DEQ90_01185 [Halieaceae bacterium]|nr:hypothetical protein [Halieaceae bacterium]